MLATFLKTVTMGTEFVWRAAMLVKSMRQKKTLTGAHAFTRFHCSFNCKSIKLNVLHPHRKITAATAWKMTKMVLTFCLSTPSGGVMNLL